MKRFLSITALILLAGCQQTTSAVPADATEGEIRMAEMMGITVEELRNQTPEEHMKAMQELMK